MNTWQHYLWGLWGALVLVMGLAACTAVETTPPPTATNATAVSNQPTATAPPTATPSATATATATATVTATPPPTAVPHTWRLVLAKQPINSHNRFLYHKTTQRTVYDEAWQGVDRTTADDVILWNERGELTETTIGNLALQLPGHGQVWYTPPLSSGLLPGTYRAHLLATGQIATRILTHDDLAQAQGVAFFNSVRRWGTAVFQPN